MDQSRAPSLLEFWRHPQLASDPFARLHIGDWIGWVCLMLVLSYMGEAVSVGALHLLGHALPADRFIMHMVSHPSWRFAALLLVAPVLEELTFRCFLSTSPRALAIGLGFAGVFVAGQVIQGVRTLAGTPPLLPHDIALHYFLNLLIGYLLVFRIGSFNLRNTAEAAALGLGGLLISLFSARHFGRFNGGNGPIRDESVALK